MASDCFETDGEHYVVLVDLHSDYIEVAALPDLSAESLINQMKRIFSTHGTPAVLLTDNGSNYSSQEFTDFMASWETYHVTSSPHHPKSNGKAESAVKIMKTIISRAKKEGTDMWKAILEWRNAPTPGMTSSPAQRLMSRRTRSMLPCSQAMYQPTVQTAVTQQILHKRKKAKHYYDRQAKALPKLVVGQPVRVKAHPQQRRSDWKPGKVVSDLSTPRSYIVEISGRKYRRNRVHLRDSYVSQDDSSTSNDKQSTKPTLPPPGKALNTSQESTIPSSKPVLTEQSDAREELTEPTVTRYGRVIKRPTRLADFTK